ncbi:fimbrillin family protein [Prevotella copri]|uniref:Fimbrillin family protein n=1 Tax=Segatella copri TaxID=165179 RepID=A0A646HLG5_9BACT|nr:fimbrillin family protein [Segatella copri]MQN90396.1 fimbrillin family protein [Segatella copri]MQO78972.1 fimbrillin family protein [Segatella copri]
MKTIKQRISYAVMGLMAMGFTACTQNEDMAPTLKGQEINATFSVGGMQTRVNTLGHGNNWEDKDKLKVRIFTNCDPGTMPILTFNGETWSHNSSFRWLDESEKHTILAVYPSSADYDPSHLVYELPTNQSSLEDLKSADLITGHWYGSPYSYVTIPMKHRMSMVTIVYHVGTADYPDMDISEPQVYSKNTSVNFNIDQDQRQFVMSTPSGNSDWVKACKHDDGMFSAIVIPGSYIKDERFVQFKIGDKNFYAKMKINTEFQEGYRYTYKLDVGKDKVELTQINVDDLKGWTNEDELK